MFFKTRCKVALRLIHSGNQYVQKVGKALCPSTDEIVAYSKRKMPPIPMPKVTHIFYHQASVEVECAALSLDTVLWNVDESDEIIIYDKGGSLPYSFFEKLSRQHWRSWAIHREVRPEMAAYTYGMNASIPMAQAPVVALWRSDYVYPSGINQKYLSNIEKNDIVLPYAVYVGAAHVTSQFMRENWNKLINYDDEFWRKNAEYWYSMYEHQDPVHFAVKKSLWLKIGGLNHDLWGYGWQFAEFAARLRRYVPKKRIKYFDHAWPIHMNHSSSLMVRDASFGQDKAEEDRIGRERFAKFLGGQELFDCYLHQWCRKLRPIPESERK